MKILVLTLTTENPIAGRKIDLLECSNKKKEEFDDVIDKIIKEEYERAKSILIANKEKHQLLVDALLKFKRLSRSEFLALMETGKIESIQELREYNLKVATSPVKQKPADVPSGSNATSKTLQITKPTCE